MTPVQTLPEAQDKPVLVRPVATPLELAAAHDDIAKLIQQSLKEGIDYGAIPGAGDKPVLLKPGAERLCIAFGASPAYTLVASDAVHDLEVKWTKKKKVWNNAHQGDRTFRFESEEGVSRGLYRYVYKCRILRPDGRCLGEGDGVASTMESKYIDRPRDCENTVLKMAQKRALVAAALNAFGLSNRFTQDIEDQHAKFNDHSRQALKDLLSALEVPHSQWAGLGEQCKPLDPRDWLKVILAARPKPAFQDPLAENHKEVISQ